MLILFLWLKKKNYDFFFKPTFIPIVCFRLKLTVSYMSLALLCWYQHWLLRNPIELTNSTVDLILWRAKLAMDAQFILNAQFIFQFSCPSEEKTAESEEPLKHRQRCSGKYSECLKSKLSPDIKSWMRETVAHPKTATGASNSIWLNQLDNKSIVLIKTGQPGKTAIPRQSPALTCTQTKGLSEGSLWCGINAFGSYCHWADRSPFVSAMMENMIFSS